MELVGLLGLGIALAGDPRFLWGAGAPISSQPMRLLGLASLTTGLCRQQYSLGWRLGGAGVRRSTPWQCQILTKFDDILMFCVFSVSAKILIKIIKIYTGRGQAELGVHIRAIHINITTVLMHLEQINKTLKSRYGSLSEMHGNLAIIISQTVSMMSLIFSSKMP